MADGNDAVLDSLKPANGNYEEGKGGAQPVGENPKVGVQAQQPEVPFAEMKGTFIVVDLYQGKNPLATKEVSNVVQLIGVPQVSIQEELNKLPKDSVGFKARLVAQVIGVGGADPEPGR